MTKLYVLLTQVGPDLFTQEDVKNNGLNTEEGLRALIQSEGLSLVVNEYQTSFQRAKKPDTYHRTFFIAADSEDAIAKFMDKYQLEGTVMATDEVFEVVLG
jgi:glutamate-1-semialdehyde aminotransferase